MLTFRKCHSQLGKIAGCTLYQKQLETNYYQDKRKNRIPVPADPAFRHSLKACANSSAFLSSSYAPSSKLDELPETLASLWFLGDNKIAGDARCWTREFTFSFFHSFNASAKLNAFLSLSDCRSTEIWLLVPWILLLCPWLLSIG